MKYRNIAKLLMPAIFPTHIWPMGGGGDAPAAAPTPEGGDPAKPGEGGEPAAPAATVVDPLASDASGIDIFAGMMENINKPNAGEPPAPLSVASVLTPEGMQKLAANQDFSKAIPAELMTKISGMEGGSDMLEAFKAMSSMAYMTALQQSAMLGESVTNSHVSNQAGQLEDKLNSSLFDKAALEAVPGIDNPIVSFAAKGIQAQLKASYPNATPDQISQMTTKYVSELSNSMNPSTATESDLTKDETDWLDWATDKK